MTDRETRLRERIDTLIDERDTALVERDHARGELVEFLDELREWPVARRAARHFALRELAA